jgi:hypothetical protein
MKKLNRWMYVLFLIFCAGFTLQAKAISLSGYAYGEFSQPIAGPNDLFRIHNADLGYSSTSSSVFNWGAARRSPHGSQFRFDGVASDAHETDFSVLTGSAFSLGEFTYTNLPTHRSSGVKGVDFRINVKFSDIGWSSFDYSLNIDNTPNDGTNEADYVSLSGAPDNVYFEHNGQSYLFEVLGFSRNDGATFEDYTFADENSSTSAGIYARVQVVPIPAAVWLFVSGGIVLISFTKGMRKI